MVKKRNERYIRAEKRVSLSETKPLGAIKQSNTEF